MTRHLLGAERNSKCFALQKFAANVYASRAVLTSARPRSSEGAELLRWVAELYYLQEQGQADIAALIGVSISKVSRLLAEARRQGIVTIKVSAPRLGESELERELAGKLGLEAVYVAPARVADGSLATRVAARMAARVVPRWLPTRGLVGFSGGYTMMQLAQALEPRSDSEVTLVPLQGNWTDGGVHLHNDQVCLAAATRLGARSLSLPAPMVVERADTRDALLNDRSIRAVTERWSELEVAVIGIGPSPGGLQPDYPSVMGQLAPDVIEDLRQQGVVGDLCAHMFDSYGHFVEHELSQRTLAIPVEQLRQVPRVVAVAGGVNKAASLLGAVRTGVPRVLITEQLTAERLLQLTTA